MGCEDRELIQDAYLAIGDKDIRDAALEIICGLALRYPVTNAAEIESWVPSAKILPFLRIASDTGTSLPAHCCHDFAGMMIGLDAVFAEMVGRSEEELLGRPFYCFTHPEEDDGARNRLHVLRETKQSYTCVKRFVRPDGSVVWAKGLISFMRGQGGQDGVLASFVELRKRPTTTRKPAVGNVGAEQARRGAT